MQMYDLFDLFDLSFFLIKIQYKIIYLYLIDNNWLIYLRIYL